MDEIIESARRAIEDNPRHSKESLFILLSLWFKDATDEELEEVIETVLH